MTEKEKRNETKRKKAMRKLLFVLLCLMLLSPQQGVAQRAYTNLVIFVRFADDAPIERSLAEIDSFFNAQTAGAYSIANYYAAFSYGQMAINTRFANQQDADGHIVAYTDSYPRGYFMPYSASNPDGYTDEVPLMGIHEREKALLARIVAFVDENQLVASDVSLDGDGDGDIDNVSFIVKGGVGAWASILWPHMEYYRNWNGGAEAYINGKRLNCFNMEFEGGGQYFRPEVFCHELGHSLGLPDVYHYINYPYVSPAGHWDLMCEGGRVHTPAINKYKYLGLTDPPQEITSNGTYTLMSVGSSSSQNCYFIRSAIDPTQWYVLEYRYREDPFETDLPESGLLVARWNDTTDITNLYAGNCFFDYYQQAHSYWLFRPGSACDTVQGRLGQAFFSQQSGRNRFDATTDPHPHLTDGTLESSFAIHDITTDGTRCSFSVTFNLTGFNGINKDGSLRCHPNPVTDRLSVDVGEQAVPVSLYDPMGRLLLTVTAHGSATIDMTPFATGVYILKTNGKTQKIIKQ